MQAKSIKGNSVEEIKNALQQSLANAGPGEAYLRFLDLQKAEVQSGEAQIEEPIQLIERFAAVFNLTYTRFNDFKIAEAHAMQAEEDVLKLQTEKKRAEDALTELQA